MIHIWISGKGERGAFRTLHNGHPVQMTIDRGTESERRTDHAHLSFPGSTAEVTLWKTLIVAMSYAAALYLHQGKMLRFNFHIESEEVVNVMNRETEPGEGVAALYDWARQLTHLLNVQFITEPVEEVEKIMLLK